MNPTAIRSGSPSTEPALARRPAIRRVDWPIVLGRPEVGSHIASPAQPGSGVVSVLSAIDELSCYQDLDTILRRAVELLRDRLGLERNGLFLFADSDGLLHGTWGTGLSGETTDEHQIAFQVGPNHHEAFVRAQNDTDRWLLLEDAPRTVQLHGETRVLENGWIVLTPIVSARRSLGLLANDGALSGAPMNPSQQTQAAVFCSLLANLVEICRHDEGAVARPRPFRARHPRNLAQTESVSRGVELIRRNPAISRAQLARQLGVTESHLGKSFKAEMGFTVADYRNRLRLEVFLGLVDRGGSNLLQAALDAGFGSYAQFHRVFRALLGTTPRQYLTGKNDED